MLGGLTTPLVHDQPSDLGRRTGDPSPSAHSPTTMERTDLSEGFDVGPIDDRDEENPEYTVNPELSSTNTNFGGEDPAGRGPEPMPEMAPAWDHEDNEEEHLTT